MDNRSLADCSQFSALILFKRPPFVAGGLLLHIPTSNYKYDIYFHLLDESTVKVSLYRYFASEWSSDKQDEFLISVSTYMDNMNVVDAALSKSDVFAHGCIWIEQSDLKAIFNHYKKFEIKQNSQIDMFA